MFATWLHFLFYFNFTGFAKYILYIFLPASCDGRVIASFGGGNKNECEKALATKIHQVRMSVYISHNFCWESTAQTGDDVAQ